MQSSMPRSGAGDASGRAAAALMSGSAATDELLRGSQRQDGQVRSPAVEATISGDCAASDEHPPC
jgi:hypothetical protein